MYLCSILQFMYTNTCHFFFMASKTGGGTAVSNTSPNNYHLIYVHVVNTNDLQKWVPRPISTIFILVIRKQHKYKLENKM